MSSTTLKAHSDQTQAIAARREAVCRAKGVLQSALRELDVLECAIPAVYVQMAIDSLVEA